MGTRTKRAGLVGSALLTVSVIGLAEPAAGDDGRRGGSDLPPDTYVADWDAVGTQAFTAAALTPAEGHTLFAYVAIAVYDSVMAIEGGYEPFAVELEAPEGASPAGSRRRRGACHLGALPPRPGRRDRRTGVHRVAADHR